MGNDCKPQPDGASMPLTRLAHGRVRDPRSNARRPMPTGPGVPRGALAIGLLTPVIWQVRPRHTRRPTPTGPGVPRGARAVALVRLGRPATNEQKTNGALGGIRTHDLSLRRAALYPAELQAHCCGRPLGRVRNRPMKCGAEGESRTRTPLRALRPERSASAISPPRHDVSRRIRPGGGRWGTRTSDLLRVKQAL